MKIAYPGTFDPITNGHLDIIERAASKFEEVVVLVLNNSAKKPLFSLEERILLIEESISRFSNVKVDYYGGLLVEYLNQNQIGSIVKGLRAFTDFEYEFQMASMNHHLSPKIETLFLMTNNKYSYVSSSIVKEAAKYGADIEALVPGHVNAAMIQKFKGGFMDDNR